MPKRIGFLREKICTASNVMDAWETFARNRPVRRRREYNSRVAVEILDALDRCDFGSGSVREKEIIEGGKIRRLRIPSFRSAIAQTALFNVIGPLIDKRLHGRTYSSRKGYGMHKCALVQNRRVQTKPKEYRYALYCDVRKFYDHIRHEDVIASVSRIFKDAYVIDAIRSILNYGGPGLPIGFPASHTLANLVMCPLYYRVRSLKGITDMFVYMDNITVYAKTKAAAKRARCTIVDFLDAHGMSMKSDWQIFPVAKRPVHTCGFRLQHGRPMRLYRNLFRRCARNIRRFAAHHRRHDALSLLSRYGWLLVVRKTHLISKSVPMSQIKESIK